MRTPDWPGLWCVLRDGAYHLVSEGLARRIGSTPVALVGMRPDVHPEDRAGFAPGRRELRLADRQGWFPTAWDIRSGNGSVLLCSVEDLTETRRAQRAREEAERRLNLDVTDREHVQGELEASKRRLLESDRMAALGALAAGVAHEINNPLIYVNLNLGRLVSLERSRPDGPLALHRLELFQNIREGMQRVERIVKNLRTFTFREDGSEVRTVDVRVPLRAALRMAWHEIQHRARLVQELREIPPVRGDEARLAQVFLNLLLNAAQAIPDGSAETNEIRVGVYTEGDLVIAEVTDTGTGMPPEMMARMFEPFFTTKPPERGTGLGLSISRDIVADHGGDVSAHSAPGRGTTVRVCLPACADAAAPRAASPPLIDETAPSTVSGRILLVDDDRAVASILASTLADRHEVVVAGSGREAMQILREDTEFDAVVCDIMMPDMNGIELYESLQAKDPAVCERFIFATGGAFTHAAQQFLRQVGRPVLEKPFRPSDLFAAIDELIAVKGRAGSLRRSVR